MQGEKRHRAQIWLHSLNILSQESSAIPKLLLKDFLKCKPSHSYSMFQDPCLTRATVAELSQVRNKPSQHFRPLKLAALSIEREMFVKCSI